MYEIGDKVKFVPCCNQEKSSGFGDILQKERKGIVVYYACKCPTCGSMVYIDD